MPIQNLVSKAMIDSKIDMDGDVPKLIVDTPSQQLGKRLVIGVFKKAFRALRLAESSAIDSCMEQEGKFEKLQGEHRDLLKENHRLERVMILRGLEIVGVSAKDRQFALPAAD